MFFEVVTVNKKFDMDFARKMLDEDDFDFLSDVFSNNNSTKTMSREEINRMKAILFDLELARKQLKEEHRKQILPMILFSAVLIFMIVFAITGTLLSFKYPVWTQITDYGLSVGTFLTVAVMLYVKEFIIRKDWKYVKRHIQVGWWIALIVNMFFLAETIVDIM
jgi:hypothetical protein